MKENDDKRTKIFNKKPNKKQPPIALNFLVIKNSLVTQENSIVSFLSSIAFDSATNVVRYFLVSIQAVEETMIQSVVNGPI